MISAFFISTLKKFVTLNLFQGLGIKMLKQVQHDDVKFLLDCHPEFISGSFNFLNLCNEILKQVQNDVLL